MYKNTCLNKYFCISLIRLTTTMDFGKALFHLNNNLGYNLYRAYLLFHRELIRALKAYSVTPEQWQVLIILWNHGSVTPKKTAG